ncbi:hypothetical protein [Corallincola spongiicola]|uniref:Uncharacterized protein n=1 Tax=Corallincola spongiicola TaxID=2520508 RepID=A0ABY1WRY6_9GAMM|nr:hypothetical protein [Corallincola spongiicola]TAA47492.1 hypothetical protein EXY25_09730 [Corallincola spongiicola]
MSLSNRPKDLRILKLLLWLGVPAGLVIAVAAAMHGDGFILFMVVTVGLMLLGGALVDRSKRFQLAKKKYKNGLFPAFRMYYGLFVLFLACSSGAVGFTIISTLGNGL